MNNDEHMSGSRHLSPARLVSLASGRQTHPHLESCAFCREQYDMLAELDEQQTVETPSGDSTAIPFRLAAQSFVQEAASQRLRQTWFLENGNVLIRVFEESAHERLVAYVICETDRFAGLRIRFSGIDEVFRPADDGSFIIGGNDIAIEPMTVELDG